MENITNQNFIYDIQKSLNEINWSNPVKDGDAPFHISLGDFCIAYKIFPEAKEYIENQLDKVTKLLKEAKEIYSDNEEIIYRKAKNKDFWNDINDLVCAGPIIKYYEYIIKRNNLALNKGSRNFVANIEKAKQYPITELIEFNNAGMAKCIFHNEKTASLKYYPKTNSVYCFGCHEYADSIKIYRHLTNCSFVDAVKKLS